MSLGHVYIVLEPVGSARLTFDDDLYYELCVLVTKVYSELKGSIWLTRGGVNRQLTIFRLFFNNLNLVMK